MGLLGGRNDAPTGQWSVVGGTGELTIARGIINYRIIQEDGASRTFEIWIYVYYTPNETIQVRIWCILPLAILLYSSLLQFLFNLSERKNSIHYQDLDVVTPFKTLFPLVKRNNRWLSSLLHQFITSIYVLQAAIMHYTGVVLASRDKRSSTNVT